jgi:CRP-like cAMP-binding protein
MLEENRMDHTDRSGPGPGRRPQRSAARGTWRWSENSLLGGLTDTARERFLSLGIMVQRPPGTVLIREEDQSTFVLILLDGVVKVTGRTQDQREALLAVRVGGDLVGEFGALDGKPRSATVTTCGPLVYRLVTRSDFLAVLNADAALSQAVSRSVVDKLRVANSRRIDFAGSNAPTRLARVIYDLAMTYGEPEGTSIVIRWPLTQPEIASLVEAAEPTVFKALKHLREAGIVNNGYRRIAVRDIEKLRAVAYP